MAEELTRGDSLILELFRSSRDALEQETLEAAQEAIEQQRQVEEGTSIAATLNQEALALQARILRLHNHPWLWLGNSATRRIVSEVDRSWIPGNFGISRRLYLTTPLLLCTEPEFVDVTAPVQGWTFSTHVKQIDTGGHFPKYIAAGTSNQLIIDQAVDNLADDNRESSQAYLITMDRDKYDHSAPVVDLRSLEVEKHQDHIRRIRHDDIAKQQPQLMQKYDRWRGHRGDWDFTYWSPNRKQLWRMRHVDRIYIPTDSQDLSELEVVKAKINAPIDPPDGLYMFPLGLIIQARRELGDRKARKVVK